MVFMMIGSFFDILQQVNPIREMPVWNREIFWSSTHERYGGPDARSRQW